jgi:dTDP-4-dehydrorhamnose 3,5-epimerase-like enzyme
MNDYEMQKSVLSDLKILDIPVVRDHRGNLAYLQWSDLPFDFKRVYYLFDIPSGARRGGHAHKQQTELLIAVSGSFDVMVDDGKNRKKINLNSPEKALLIPRGIWREIENFSANSICLVLNSDLFSEADYIRDYETFLNLKNAAK